jgi:pyridoxamine 5'-phosphate oxidase
MRRMGPRTLPLLDPAGFAGEPLEQFDRWYDAAIESGIAQPEAVALATATPDGRPSVRWVLYKGLLDGAFTFYTHYESRKGRELLANPRAALGFYWEPLGRQIRIEGAVTRLSAAQSDAYFASRPESSRFSAAASPQSAVVGDRAELEQRVAELRARHADGKVPRPANWGGFALAPDAVEFWQQGPDRLHDRLRYVRDGAAWRLERLAP